MPTNYSTSIFTGTPVAIDDYFVTVDPFRQGNLWTWGRNGYGQLGDNTVTFSRCTPVTTFVGGANWKQVTAGNLYKAAIKTDGTLWTWGANFSGRLGDNTTINRSTPVTTFAGGTNWKQVAGGASHVTAIKTDGTLWTWGGNFYAQLGDNTTIDRSTPVTTFAGGTNWKQVSCGGYHTAAIKTDGTIWSWGLNNSGNLGINNTTIVITTPVTTFAGGNNWKQVSCGRGHTSAIKTDGTLWVWGGNSYAQLGNGTTNTSSIPITTFAGGTNWRQVASGRFHIAAIKTDGTLWAWGECQFGQLGDNTTITARSTPVTTFAGGTNWKQVDGKNRHVAAIKTDGTLWTWGQNSSGQLGDNTIAQKNTPLTTFAGGTNWKQVSCGDSNTSALTYIDDYQ